jgi:hypothetical protein
MTGVQHIVLDQTGEMAEPFELFESPCVFFVIFGILRIDGINFTVGGRLGE